MPGNECRYCNNSVSSYRIAHVRLDVPVRRNGQFYSVTRLRIVPIPVCYNHYEALPVHLERGWFP